MDRNEEGLGLAKCMECELSVERLESKSVDQLTECVGAELFTKEF